MSFKFPRGQWVNLAYCIQTLTWGSLTRGQTLSHVNLIIKRLRHKYVFIILDSMCLWKLFVVCWNVITYLTHYSDVIMSMMAYQITGILIVHSTVCSGADQRKRQISTLLAFVRGIHRWPVNSPCKGPVMRKMFPFDDVIMIQINAGESFSLLWLWCKSQCNLHASLLIMSYNNSFKCIDRCLLTLNLLTTGRCSSDIELVIFKLRSQRSSTFPLKLPSGESHKTSLMSSQHWFR